MKCTAWGFRLVLPVLVGAATRQAPADSADACEELCKHAKGVGASSCMTECKMYTETAPDNEKALKSFVHDETYNEHGGEGVENAFETTYKESVPSCTPTFTGVAKFTDMDMNGDSVIDKKELIKFAHMACVSDEMASQMFSEADKNGDGVIDPLEYEHVGENTQLEEGVDIIMDPETQGDDEYNPVKLPPLESFDGDKDGKLSLKELEDALFLERQRRYGSKNASTEELKQWAEDKDEVLQALLFLLDKNGDGFLDAAEYNNPDLHDDLGGELKEARDADHNSWDQDDEKRVEHPALPASGHAPAPAAAPVGMVARFGGALTFKEAREARHKLSQRSAAAARQGEHGHRLRRRDGRHAHPRCPCPADMHQLGAVMRQLRVDYGAWEQRHKAIIMHVLHRQGRQGSLQPAVAELKAMFAGIVGEASWIGNRVGFLRARAGQSPGRVELWQQGLRRAARGAEKSVERLQMREARIMPWDADKSAWKAMRSLASVLRGVHSGAEELARPFERQLETGSCQCFHS